MGGISFFPQLKKETRKVTNRKWFILDCTLIDNDIRHNSGRNVVDSRDAAQ